MNPLDENELFLKSTRFKSIGIPGYDRDIYIIS